MRNTMNNIIINESSFTDFLNVYRPGKRFVLNSVFQGKLSYADNVANTRYFRSRMKDAGYSMLRIMGSFRERFVNYECMISWPPKEDAEEDIINFFCYWGIKFKQNKIMYIDENNTIWDVATTPNSTVGSLGRKFMRGKFIPGDFIDLVRDFTKYTYVFDKVKIITD